jgi:hypothetical protein
MQECTELYLLELLHKTPHVESALVVAIHGGGGGGGGAVRGAGGGGGSGTASIEVFLPKYQLRGRVRLTDGRGLVVEPMADEPSMPSTTKQQQQQQQAGGSSEHAAGQQQHLPQGGDAFDAARRARLALRMYRSGGGGGDGDGDATTHGELEIDRVEVVDGDGSGAVLWSAALWSRVWVRLAADASRAHRPSLTMAAVADCHPLVAEAARAKAAADAAEKTGVQAATATMPSSRDEGGLVGGMQALALQERGGARSGAPTATTHGGQLPPVLAAAHAAAAAAKARAAAEPQQQQQLAQSGAAASGGGGQGCRDGDTLNTATFAPPPLANADAPPSPLLVISRALRSKLARCDARLDATSLRSSVRPRLASKRALIEQQLLSCSGQSR